MIRRFLHEDMAIMECICQSCIAFYLVSYLISYMAIYMVLLYMVSQ